MSESNEKIAVLFVCTGNACRSQMAEGWARHLKSDVIDAYSAGILPAGVSSRAAKVMAEAGVDISSQTSKHLDELVGIDFDYVVTLCDNAREYCPVFPACVCHIHESFEDPSLVIGSEEEIMTGFRRTCDAIKAFVETLPESLQGKNPKD
ncbi:MAG: arsenate reductase ArsC [Planctomycetota bacterium]|jgi:arsenate reductase